MHAVSTHPLSRLTPILLIGAALILLAIMAVPRRPLTPAQTQALQEQHGLVLSIDTLRGAVDEYRRDHEQWPGTPPLAGLGSQPSSSWFVRQLTMASNALGQVAPAAESAFPLGPYLTANDLLNPITQRSGIYLLGGNETMPSEAWGDHGWIFDPRNGELRMNTAGVVDGTDLRYFDL